MYIPNHSNKSSVIETEQKNFTGSHSVSWIDYLSSSGNGDLSNHAALDLYSACMPFFNSVDMRATALSLIPVRLYDKVKEEFVDKHPILELLAEPNLDKSQEEFMYALSSYFDICGEAFVVATGRTEAEPLELINVSPAHTGFGKIDNRFGLLNIADTIKVYSNNTSNTFKAVDDKRRLRYINSTNMLEAYHIANFNPLKSAGIFRGMSRAKPLWLEMQQYVSGNKTNLSMLKRGTTLSMAWVNTSKEALTNTQWERMQEEAAKYAGENNAGGTPVLDGMDVKNIGQTNKDMEFKELQDAMLSRVSNAYDIPLALLLDKTMSYNNLETAIVQLYDLSVLPLAKRIFSELTKMLMRRYKNSENLELRYNESEIPAVRARLIETAKKQKDIGAYTTNELREVTGATPLDNSGNTVLVQSSMIALDLAESANDLSDSNNVVDSNADNIDDNKALDIFVRQMKASGKFSKDEIFELAIENGLM